MSTADKLIIINIKSAQTHPHTNRSKMNGKGWKTPTLLFFKKLTVTDAPINRLVPIFNFQMKTQPTIQCCGVCTTWRNKEIAIFISKNFYIQAYIMLSCDHNKCFAPNGMPSSPFSRYFRKDSHLFCNYFLGKTKKMNNFHSNCQYEIEK